jgi:membrane fusion protein, multidrug efflux system
MKPKNSWSLSIVTLAVATLAACGQKTEPAAAAPGRGVPPAEVGVITASPQSVGLSTELPGRLEASRVSQVRARAAGIVLQRSFAEGSDVKKGQLLFNIDAAPYRVAAASAQAALSRAQANLTQTSALAERYKPLLEANAISKQEYVNAVAAQKTAEADVATSRANIQAAQINLGYATVTAPIAGRIGRALVTEGALVGVGDVTPLATIQQINPIYVNFTQSTTDVLRLRKAIASGQFKPPGTGSGSGSGFGSGSGGGFGAASVSVVLEDGSDYGQRGKLLFSDLSVDSTTGQITLRAEIPNAAGLLLPGMYVRVRLEQAQADAAFVVPQQAVVRGTSGDTVMVVGDDGKVTPRPVKIGSSVSGQWLVLDGLKAGEKVMVDGFQKLRGNAPVKPVPWNAAASGAAASSSSGVGAGPSAGTPASTPAAASAASR